MQSPKIN